MARRFTAFDRRWVPVVALLCCLTLAPSTSFAGDPPAQIDPAGSCIDAGCHASQAQHEHLHWPEVAEPGQCQRCHVPDQDQHVFEKAGSVRACLSCHEDLMKEMRGARLRHKAARKDCLDCHDPHGSAVEGLLIKVEKDDLGPLCFTCHDEDIIEQESTHGPAAKGACGMCHDPHASNRGNLLLADGADLCTGCHEDLGEMIQSASVIHDPAEDDCIECHDPHSGPHPNMLRRKDSELCYECHAKVQKRVETARVEHSPVSSADGCLTCHSPHASDHAQILKLPQRDLCLDCHDQPVEAPDGWLIDMASWLEQNEVWHEPVIEDDCSGCHDPHGGRGFRLLKRPFPSKFYADFDPRKYSLCFSCHESEMVMLERTRTATRFRDGDQNLHFLHVNRDKRGRSCRACHEVHASNRPLHVRESVPYGKWLMPINYEKTAEGGSCSPGCHAFESYSHGTRGASSKD